MTATINPPEQAPRATAPPTSRGVSPRSVWTVARLDLTQRLRASRTSWTIGFWVLFVYGFVALMWFASRELNDPQQPAIFYGGTVMLVLSLALLVAPSLSASAISGDREQGVLATLQTTLLSPAEIGLGKLLAAWLAAMGFLAIAAPVLIWALLAGGVTPGHFAMALVTLSVVLLAVCAIGLAISSLTARTVSSVVLTYVTVGFLALGTPLVFGLTKPMVTSEEIVQVRTYADFDGMNWPPGPIPEEAGSATASPGTDATVATSPATPGASPPADATPAPMPGEPDFGPMTPEGFPECREITALRPVSHTERNWWLLAPSPYVIVADAAPERRVPDERGYVQQGPLGGIADAVRSARNGPPEVHEECWGSQQLRADEDRDMYGRPLGSPIWPIGFVTYGLLAVGGTLIAIRRLRTPVRKLPRGIRIA